MHETLRRHYLFCDVFLDRTYIPGLNRGYVGGVRLRFQGTKQEIKIYRRQSAIFHVKMNFQTTLRATCDMRPAVNTFHAILDFALYKIHYIRGMRFYFNNVSIHVANISKLSCVWDSNRGKRRNARGDTDTQTGVIFCDI